MMSQCATSYPRLPTLVFPGCSLPLPFTAIQCVFQRRRAVPRFLFITRRIYVRTFVRHRTVRTFRRDSKAGNASLSFAPSSYPRSHSPHSHSRLPLLHRHHHHHTLCLPPRCRPIVVNTNVDQSNMIYAASGLGAQLTSTLMT